LSSREAGFAKGDPDHDRVCADIRAQIAALPEGSVVLAEDETHLDLLARVRACWMPRGVRHRVVTPGSNIRRTVHGAGTTCATRRLTSSGGETFDACAVAATGCRRLGNTGPR
jgi:hypothetical protein